MNKLSKNERLNSKIDIEKLFSSNNQFILQNIKVYWRVINSKINKNSVLFSVPKKFVPLSIKRNKIKRLMKESYRINKHILRNNNQIHLSIIYLESETPKYNTIEKKIKLILQRLNDEL